MKVLLTGATGLIGRELGLKLHQSGHELVVISRNREKALQQLPFPCDVHQGDLSQAPLQKPLTVDAVFHLAGESVASGRWSESRKKAIRDSRVLGTTHLWKSLAIPPRQVITASAIGIYGDQKESLLSEDSSKGQDFLAQVCLDWEAELMRGASAPTQVCVLRLGVVLSAHGGALAKMFLPFRLGLGGKLGAGQQWMSWIHIDDLVSLFIWVFQNSHQGLWNAVAPEPVTNAEFTKSLAAVLRRPVGPPVPAFALKVLLGEMSQMLLASQKVSCQKLLKAGFQFQYPTLSLALGHLLADDLQRSTPQLK